MTAFGRAVIEIANNPAYDTWTFPSKIRLALHVQVTDKQEHKTLQLSKASQLPHPDVCVEEIRYLPDRNLNHELFSRLASCQWTRQARARISKTCWHYISFFRLAKNDSVAALSQHTSVRPMYCTIPFSAQ